MSESQKFKHRHMEGRTHAYEDDLTTFFCEPIANARADILCKLQMR